MYVTKAQLSVCRMDLEEETDIYLIMMWMTRVCISMIPHNILVGHQCLPLTNEAQDGLKA